MFIEPDYGLGWWARKGLRACALWGAFGGQINQRGYLLYFLLQESQIGEPPRTLWEAPLTFSCIILAASYSSTNYPPCFSGPTTGWVQQHVRSGALAGGWDVSAEPAREAVLLKAGPPEALRPGPAEDRPML